MQNNEDWDSKQWQRIALEEYRSSQRVIAELLTANESLRQDVQKLERQKFMLLEALREIRAAIVIPRAPTPAEPEQCLHISRDMSGVCMVCGATPSLCSRHQLPDRNCSVCAPPKTNVESADMNRGGNECPRCHGTGERVGMDEEGEAYLVRCYHTRATPPKEKP